MEDTIIGIVVVSSFVASSFVVWTIANTIRRIKRDRRRYETQSKLLDKFGSSAELLEYLKTDPGQQFLESTELERSSPHGRILRAMQAGILSFFVGCALLFMRNQLGDDVEGVLVFGSLLVALGLGFLVSSGLSYKLSNSWGLLSRDETAPSSQEALNQ